MEKPLSWADLEAFAQKCINAERYPNDYHTFSLSRCPACGLVAFELTIEHHTGSRQGDFKGRILGQCSQCGETQRIFSFTGSHRRPLRAENPQCSCGNQCFFVAECERIDKAAAAQTVDFAKPPGVPAGTILYVKSQCGFSRATLLARDNLHVAAQVPVKNVSEDPQAARELEHGELEQLAVYAEDAVIILTTIAAGYFLVLVLARDGLAGKGRFVSRLTRSRLYSEFI